MAAVALSNGQGVSVDLADQQFILAWQGSQMDDIRTEIWEAIRHLFPDNVVAIALEQGDVLVSWKTNEDRFRPNKRSAPIYLRFDPALVAKMRLASPKQRESMVAREVDTVKAGLWGYQPEEPLQNARFIVLG